MKNLLLIPAMVLAIASAKATSLPTLSIVKDKIFVLNTNEWRNYELNVSFFTPEGLEIYSEKIQPAEEKQKEYNLQVLRKGTYQVVVSNGIKSITYDIVVNNDSIVKISRSLDEIYSNAISKDIRSKIKFISNN